MADDGVRVDTAAKVGMMMREDSYDDELAMPIVKSDVLQSPRQRPRKTISSLATGQQTPTSARVSHQLGQSPTDPARPLSHMRLAVHIRSTPIKPFTPINAPASDGSSTLPSRLGRTRGRPRKSPASTRPPTPDPISILGAKSERDESEPSSVPKKRGRPKGWKPGTPYTTDPASRYRKREARAAGLTPGQSHGHEQKRRGRPPKAPPPPVHEEYLKSKPDYIPYKCEWVVSEVAQLEQSPVCPAELHNFDTLRKHVYWIHGEAEPLVCRFSHCGNRNPPLRFETTEEFEKHMEKKHFERYLWYRGEGYQNKGIWTLEQPTADKLPAYLFDEQWNQVTPSIINQKLEDEVEHKERKRKLRRLLHQQNENAPSEEEWTKQMLGID
ncbi:hypothetical protein GGS20DRAFT_570609 [Poronia punctata]|nr:hypothetical protein GGS20DRAFT_570609 [Poronia punctata]